MSSAVYYRFRSSKTPQRLAFDGTGISIFEIKRGILVAQGLDATADSFQLVLSNPDTSETYEDDSEVLPRSSLVEARRLPVFRPGGHDAASQYVSGSLAMSVKNASRREDFRQPAAQGLDSEQLATAMGSGSGSGSEQDMMNAMFAQQGAQWSLTQQEMATKTKVYTPRPGNPTEVDKTLPPGYICHRCGQKGHWITNCPSLYDRNWETKKVLRTTGIPKSMLRTVQKPEADVDGAEDGKTYLMNAEGEYVVAVADDKSWQAFQDRQLQNQARNKRAVPPEIQDPISHLLLRDPHTTPCCHTTYSYESIESALIQTDFTCPKCGTADIFFDQLKPDKDAAKRVAQFEGADADDENAVDDNAVDDNAVDDNEEDDSDYSPLNEAPTAKKRRRSSASDSSDPKSPEPKPEEPKVNVHPFMLPFMFNPFMLPAVNSQPEDKEDSDYDPADDQPVMGRIR